MARQDFLLDADKNILCLAGDFSTGESDAQHVELLVSSNKGMFKESPTVGAGLIRFLKRADTAIREMRREINVQLAADGYKMTDLAMDENGEYQIEYKNVYQ